MNDILEQVKQYAAAAHGEQRRKYRDELYINHPVRVSEHCQRHVTSLSIAAAALLHDVLEDTEVKEEELETFLLRTLPAKEARHTLHLVKDLTDVYTHAEYPMMNRRRRKENEAERLGRVHPDAQTIKCADIIDNTQDIVASGDDFAPAYLKECKAILTYLTKANAELYKEAVETVERGLRELPV